MKPTTLTPGMAAALWAEVLGVADIGVDDELVGFGADSLHTARMIARLRLACGREVPFRVVFDAATPRALAEALAEQEPVAAAAPAGPAVEAAAAPAGAGRWPLSHDQQRLWLLDQNGEGGTAYHLTVVLRLHGELDRPALERALHDLVARHGTLRTRFVLDGHQPRQEVLPSGQVALPVVDAAGADVLGLAAELAAPRFDLSAAPPWRVALYRLAADDHVLAFVLHHTIFDGWSEEMLRRELSELYAAHRDGRAPRLPALAVQYTDHAARQHEIPDDAYAGQLDYWRRQLAGSTQLDLPTDRPRPPVWSSAGASHTFTIDAGVAVRVRELTRANGGTPFMALLATWTALLGRLCQVDDVVVGTSTADRGRPELEDLIGSFVSTLVIRAELAGRPTFRQLLAAVRETALDALANKDVPFERLVAELDPDRQLSGNPLFNVMFAYLNMPVPDEGWPGLRVRRLALPARTATFDVTLAVQDQPDGTLRGYLEYSTALFEPGTVERIGRYYGRLLDAFTAHPDTPLDAVALLSQEERRELLVDRNATTAPLPDTGLPAVLRQAAGRTPDAVAVACGNRTLTYAELDAAANRLANHLRGQGVGPETAVAIRLPRSVDQVVAMLAVWKAGGYYVALDDEHPPERIALMLADAAPLILVTRGAERIDGGEQAGVAKVVCLDRDRADIEALPSGPPGVAVPPDALAAAIYTSGSTGTPKAVALTHRNVLSAQVGRDAYRATPACLLLPVSFAFDVFLTFAVWTLRAGGRMVIPVEARGADLDELATLVCGQRVTHLVATPDTQRALLARDDVRAGNRLTLGVVGGQSCPQAVLDDYARWAPGARLVNEYGLTETSAGTYFLTDRPDQTGAAGGAGGDDPGAGALPIGRPAANNQVYLLDANLEPVPAGVPAELYLGGPGIARGYLGHRGLTADRFVPDPFQPGQRLYRTGDLARVRAGGVIEFLGRRDHQVKVRGYRIELAEIEAALLADDAVAVTAVVHLPEQGELAAYVVPAGGTEPTPAQLRAHLRQRLPEPMVPALFVTLPELPLTPNGKVDRAALAARDVNAEPGRVHTGPRTPAEETVAGVWAEVLELPDGTPVDVHTDFFQLGGHSLLAATVVSRLRAAFPVPLSLRDLFGSPTVAGLAEVIGARMLEAIRSQFGAQVAAARPAEPDGRAERAVPAERVEPPEPAEQPITPARRDGPVPLSAGQRQLWLVDRIQSGSLAYQVPLAIRLSGELDVAALGDALDEVVARHEVLRTRIELVDDEPVQLVDPQRGVDLPVIESTVDELDGRLDELAATPFDLAADLMIRATLVRLAAAEHVLLLVLHHIAGDGESVKVVVAELAELYAANEAGWAPALDWPALQYGDYATWYQQRAASGAHQRQLDYWSRQLDGLVTPRLPADRPARTGPDTRGGCVEFVVDGELAAGLRTLGGRHGATPFMTMLAAFKVLLARTGAGTDLAVGTPVSGRGRSELDGLVGYFGNTIVLRTQLPGTLPFSTALDRVRRTTTDGLANADVAFATVVERIAPERDLAANPLFNVLFSYEIGRPPLPGLGRLDTTELTLPVRQTQFDLVLRLAERADGSVLGELEYATALFDPATAARLGEQYLRVLRSVLADPGAAVGGVPLLGDADRRQLDAWNDTERDYQLAPLGRLVAEQAARTPDAPAVLGPDGDRWLSYAEFASGVHRLARYLRRTGIGVDDVVGVYLPRGADLVTAIHAVTAAGAAYLPLPPDQPAARLAGMLADAGARTVLTTSDLAGSGLFRDRAGHLRLVCLDGEVERAAIAAEPDTSPDLDVPLDALAYVIFTSGSTGRPKGVGVSHRAIGNRLHWMQETFRLDAGDRVLHKTPYSFDVSVWELYWPLLTGAGLVVAADGGHRDPAYLAGLIGSAGVTTAHFVPSMLRAFLDDLPAEPAGRLGSLHRVVCSGEALTADLAARFLAALPGVELHNLYGPTEAAVDVSWHACRWPDGSNSSVPIGRPVANTRLEVLDRHGNRTPVGVPGELCIGGVQLARGYLGQAGLTADRFRPDPLAGAGQRGQRLYRTGDLARWTTAGEVEFLGRLDDQVKLHGVRIEPAEIEAALRDHPAVGEAAVRVWLPADGDPRLVAYLVPDTALVPCQATLRDAAEQPDAGRLHDFLLARLPASMIPAQFVTVPGFPLTASGKLDRKALPEPDRPGAGDTGHLAPRDDTERAIAEVWAAVLDVDRVGVLDNFFALGGNSIRAVRLVGRLAARGFTVSVPDLFRHRTVASLAAVVAGPATAEPAGAEPGVERFALVSEADLARLSAGVEDAYPLSMVQAGMVYEMLADADQDRSHQAYHNVTGYLIHDDRPLSVPALRAAADAVVRRHEVLRTSFDVTGDGEPLQLVHRDAQIELVHVDLRGQAADEQDQAVRAALDAERRRPFDLSRPPLLRLRVHQLADDQWRLTTAECHAVLDGWSHDRVLTELLAGYRDGQADQADQADQTDQTGQAGPAPARFAEFVAVERATVERAEHREFWASRVGGFERLTLPAGWGDQAGRADRADAVPCYEVRVGFADLEAGLRRLAGARGVPLKSVLLAAHLMALGTISGQRRFHAGLVCNGRPERDGADLTAGMFLNSVPFAVDLAGRSRQELVDAVFAEEAELWPHRRFPLPVLQREWGHGSPLLETVFNYTDFDADRLAVQVDRGVDASPNEFAMQVNTEPAGLVLTIRADRIAREHGELLGRVHRGVLAALVADPDGPASGPFLPAERRRHLLAAWNRTEAALPDRRVHHMFADQAAATPDRIALVAGGERISYAELDRRADRLARRLARLGAGPESVVALCLDRRAELVVAMLAVLRTGAAYLPLDPAQPADRLHYMVSHARARVVLVDGGSPRDALPDQSPDGPIEIVDVTSRGSDGTATDDETGAVALKLPVPGQENPAYVIFTSGSTGRPKGVVIRHRALTNFLCSMHDRPGLTSDDVLVAVTTVSFDIAVLELFLPLVAGARVVLASRDQAVDAGQLAELVAAEGATALQATPSTWRMLREARWRPPARFTALCGGEKLPTDLAGWLASTGADGWDVYGPTETTVWSTAARIGDGGAPAGWAPLANTTVHVLDPDLEPVLPGAAGEVYIGGTGLARGYFGRPDLTADRFVPDPHAGPGTPGARLYRTGDVARRHRDGTVEILGRADHQIKIRGHRIEPGEVDAVLARHPDLAAAVVHPTRTPAGEWQLTAYLVGRDGRTPSAGELRGYLADALPAYLIPTAYVPLDALPLTANGKVDRRALPDPGAGSQHAGGRIVVAPRTPAEQTLTRLWASVLGVDRVGVYDDFIELGGHSLLAMRITVAAREHGIPLTVRDLMARRTVAGVLAADWAGAGDPSRALVWFRRPEPGAGAAAAPPLFCVHPGDGSTHWYAQLSQAVGDRQPLAAFEWPANHGDTEGLDSVEQAAERYLAELREAQPSGPYRLFGWCAGAALTWELARLLDAGGEQVELSLLDPLVDVAERPNFTGQLALYWRCEELFAELAAGPDEATTAGLRAEIVAFLRLVVDDPAVTVTDEDVNVEWRNLMRAWRRLLEANIGYPFRPYRGRLRLLICDEVRSGDHVVMHGLDYPGYLDRWRELAGGGLELHPVPGDHLGVLGEPNVAELAGLLSSTARLPVRTAESGRNR